MENQVREKDDKINSMLEVVESLQQKVKTKDEKYDKLKKLSQDYLDKQKSEFQSCISRLEKDLEQKTELQESLEQKQDEITKLELQICEL